MITIHIFITCGALLAVVPISSQQNTPKGHLQPLGSHRPQEGSVESLDYVPLPKDFYYNYVLASKPVLLKGAAKGSKGFSLWTDDYLREHYGDEIVRVDYGKKENRDRSADDMTLASFLSTYNQSDQYLVDTLPRKMWKEFSLPRCLLCGGFTEALQDSVLWFSSGGTKSHFHNDKVENINCLLSGHKKWFFVDALSSKNIEMDHKEGEYCSVNVERVDMYKYSSLQNIPWWSAEIQAGDCIYVPYGWAHQVTSFSRNLAVNIWWSPGITFNNSNCEVLSHKELSNFKFKPGEMLRFQAIQVINEYGGSIGFEEIHKLIVHEHHGERLITKERFSLLDINGDGVLTENELQSTSSDVIEEAFGHTHPGEVNLMGKSRPLDEVLAKILASISQTLPPYIEEFLLRPDKLASDMKGFLEEHSPDIPLVLIEYLKTKMSELRNHSKDSDRNFDEL